MWRKGSGTPLLPAAERWGGGPAKLVEGLLRSARPLHHSLFGERSPSPAFGQGGAFRELGEIGVAQRFVGQPRFLGLVDEGVGIAAVEQLPLLGRAVAVVALVAVDAVF